MCRNHVILGLAGCLLLSGSGTVAADDDTVRGDEQALREAKLGTDGPALVDFFRKRTLTDAGRDRIQILLRQLGDRSFSVRERASGELVTVGMPAVPLLRETLKSSDPEVVRRAEDCLHQIEGGPGHALLAAAARLLAARKPEGAAEALLAYLPFAPDDLVVEEVRTSLAAVARRDGKLAPALPAALTDKLPARRAAAAEALCRIGATEQLPAVRKLLQDADPSVRLQVALALIDAKDRDAVPVLIRLLAELPPERGWQAEDVLCRLAGDDAPKVTLEGDAAARQKCSAAWAAWWDKSGPQLDLAKLDADRLLGYTLGIVFDKTGGTVFELGPDGSTRWRIQGLSNPVDARSLPGNRVLIAEHGANRVSERDFKGAILWEKQVSGPIGCQRLRNGNTFIVTMNRLLEVNPSGKEVFTLARSIRAAYKFPDGQIGVVGQDHAYSRLDASGKERKSVPVQIGIANAIGGIDFLRDGRLLVSQAERVVEYDTAGKIVWEAKVSKPYCITRLPNGNTLVACTVNRRILELDRQGKEVRHFDVDGTPWLGRRR